MGLFSLIYILSLQLSSAWIANQVHNWMVMLAAGEQDSLVGKGTCLQVRGAAFSVWGNTELLMRREGDKQLLQVAL